MKKGIEIHRWGYYIKKDGKLIATCLANTLYEAKSYFEDIELVVDSYVEIKIINQIKENVSNMLTVKEVLDILDDSDHLDDAKTLIRETVS